jgi:HK97 family phage major capsid protein
MNCIQALREERADLMAQARKLIADNPGASWTPALSAKVDKIYAKVDELDREVHEMQSGLNAEAEARFGGRDWVNESGDRVPVAYASRGKLSRQLRGAYRNENAGDERVSLADFMRGIANVGPRTPGVQAALSVGTDSSGGYAVPAEIQLDVLDALAPTSSLLRAGVGVSVLEPGAKQYRIAAVNTIPTAAWRAESGAVATSDPAFRAVDLIPRSLAFQFKVSRELLADSTPNLEDALRRVIAQAFAKELDRAGLRGTGTAPEIRGVLNTTGIQAITNGANGASLATTAYQNVLDAAKAIRAADGPMPTAAIMAPRSLFVLAGLLDTTNQPRRVPPFLERMQFIDSSQVPVNLTVGTSNDASEIYVADFSTCAFFFRESMSLFLAKELYAGTGEVGFFCHVRADFAKTYPAALAVVTGVRP